MQSQGYQPNYQNKHRSSSDEKFQEFGSNIRSASQRADQLLQNSLYPQQQPYVPQYSQPVPLANYYPQQQLPQQQLIYNPIIQQQPVQQQPIYHQPQIQVQQMPQFQQPIQQMQYNPVVQSQPTQKVEPVQVQQYYPPQEKLQQPASCSYISGQEKGQPQQEIYYEYIPQDRTEIEYIPVQKIEYIPQEKKIREYKKIQRVIEKVPVKTYETTIEYVPVERVQEHVEYQITQKEQVIGNVPEQQPQPQYQPQYPVQGYNPVTTSRPQY